MERIALLHSRLPLTIAALLTILMIWGLIAAVRGRFGQGYTAALWIAALLIITQGSLGLLLFFSSGRPGRLALHLVYGVVAVISLPGALHFNRGRTTRRAALSFAAVCFLLLGIAGRAFVTAL
ncbi:MAG: hypothetical protein WCP31_10240 [Chloroflexales bacterium]